MTSGTRKTGLAAPVVTGAGPTTDYHLYVEKTWEGTDYAKAKPRPGQPYVRQRFIDVIGPGFEKFEADLGPPALPRIRGTRREFVKRKYEEDHPYHGQFLKRTDRPFTMVGPFGYSLTQTHSQGGWDPTAIALDEAATQSVDNKVLGRLRNKVAGSDFNAGVAWVRAVRLSV